MKIIGLIALLISTVTAADVQNVLVYKEAGRFGGWPANHGIWSWGNEILVGFSAAYFKQMPLDRHQYDNTKPEEPRLARSLDGGVTWTIEAPKSLLPPEQGGLAVTELKQPIDFQDPNFAMTIRYVDKDKGESRLFYSTDRGKSWKGPYIFPMLGMPGVLARTDYVVEGKRQAMVVLTASKTNGKEGRLFCARTTDGGLHWKFVSWIGDEPSGFRIMPSTVRFPNGDLLTAGRDHAAQEKNWIDTYRSKDKGASWTKEADPLVSTGGKGGNPPYLLRLQDGRVCLTYGYRAEPFGIRARISKDEGKTWGEEILLRDDGAWWDLGYVRSAQRPDGKVVTVYYFNDQKQSERFIEATIWDPGKK